MQNREIEIHDSELEQITLEGTTAVLRFPHVYIHASAGRPGIDAGTGWGQRALLRIGNAGIEGSFSDENREGNRGVWWLSDGALTVNGSVSDNLIPIPLDVHGEVELKLECRGEVVRIHGNSAKLELIGDARYIENFEPHGTDIG
jgi:hypothetical protein